MDGPLSGIRVVEAASYVTGPLAAMALADLGAEVVKVEPPPRGDPFRNFGVKHAGTSVWFINVNRGKRSALIDLKSDDGRDAFLGLVRRADVFVQNWRPGVADGLGVGDAVLAAANPGLVRLSITGYGRDGPRARRPAFDSLLQAHSGLAAHQGGPERPELVRSILADKTTAMVGVQSVLAALVARARHGRGERIDLAMLDVMAYFNFPDVFQDRTFLSGDGRDGAGSAAEARRGRSGVVATADGFIVVAPVSGAQIARALDAVGHPEWKDDLKKITDPVLLADTMIDRVEQVTVTRSTAHWIEAFGAADVPVAEVLDLDGHLGDAQVVHNRVYRERARPDGARQREVRYPALFASGLAGDLRPAPAAGEHTDEILAELHPPN